MSIEHDKKQVVAITGIGMMCPLGITTNECWENLLAGKSGISWITRFDARECRTRIAGQLPPKYFELEKNALPRRLYQRSVLPSRLSILIARQALENAGLKLDEMKGSWGSVITGCGGSTFGDSETLVKHEKKKIVFSHDMLNALSACVAIELGFKGPSFNVAAACASGAFAVGMGYNYVKKTGELCVAIGVEAVLYKDTIDGFNQLMALSENNEYPQKASCPFDKKRSGFVISEGACALILEPYEHAVNRGARIYALMSGLGLSFEAFNIIAPEPEGSQMAKAMSLALQNGYIEKEQVGYINAHGTSTPHNDLAETKAIKRLFGDEAYKIPVSSIKSMVGHTIGAAGAIECAATALALYHQVLPPTINYEDPDPECDLDYVPNNARKVEGLEVALTNSFGFGGHNVTLLLARHHSSRS